MHLFSYIFNKGFIFFNHDWMMFLSNTFTGIFEDIQCIIFLHGYVTLVSP